MIQAIIATTAVVGFLVVLAIVTGGLALIDHHCNKFRSEH